MPDETTTTELQPVHAEKLHIAAVTRPLSMNRELMELDAGVTITELLQQLGIPSWASTRVFVGTALIPPEMYSRVWPKRGASVTVRVVPRGGSGGDGQGKNIGMLVAGILLIIVGAVIAGGSLGTFAPIGGLMISAGVSLALSGVCNMLIPRMAPAGRSRSGMIESHTTRVPKVVELLHEHKLVYQVQYDDGRAPDLEELQALARATGGSGRYVCFVLLDESRLRDHGQPADGCRPDFRHFSGCGPNIPLVLNDDLALRVGTLHDLRLQEPDAARDHGAVTTGAFLFGFAELDNSPLAAAVWDAMRANVLNSFCAVYGCDIADGRAIFGDLQRIIVVPQRDAACAAARILALWQDPLRATTEEN